MAEGTQEPAPMVVTEEEEAGAVAAPSGTMDMEEGALPTVRSKQRPLLPVDCAVELREAGSYGRAGEWWQSSALGHKGFEAGHHEPQTRGSSSVWRERCLMEDDGKEWSYSTTPGSQTMDILRTRFGVGGQGLGQRTPVGATTGRTGPSRSLLEGPSFQSLPGFGMPREGSVPAGLGRGIAGVWSGTEDGPGQPTTRSVVAFPSPGPQVASWGPGVVWGPPPLSITYDGRPDLLAMFLGQVIGHMDQYAQAYVSQWAMVVAVTAFLQGEAAAWVADLYSDHARELGDVGLFLDALRARFEDISRVQRAEADILCLRQRGRPAVEFVREFHKVAGKLRSWPERLLVHHFRAGLDGALRRACVVRGVPTRLQEWYRVAVELDIGLQDVWGRPEPFPGGRRSAEKAKADERPVETPVRPSTQPARAVIRCYRCDQPGHQAADCLLPPARAAPSVSSARGVGSRRSAERTRATHQLAGDVSRPTTPTHAEMPAATQPAQ